MQNAQDPNALKGDGKMQDWEDRETEPQEIQ